MVHLIKNKKSKSHKYTFATIATWFQEYVNKSIKDQNDVYEAVDFIKTSSYRHVILDSSKGILSTSLALI